MGVSLKGLFRSRKPAAVTPADLERVRAAAWAPAFDPVAAAASADPAKISGKVKVADLLWFAEQLRTTEEAGVPIYRALGMLAKMRAGSPFGKRLAALQRAIADGSSLTEALAADSRAWNPTVVALISAGESSGSFSQSFKRASDLLSARLRLRRKLRSALTYPTVVLMVTVVLVAALLFFVVPRFEEIYSSVGGELPGITQFVLALADKAKYGAIGLAVIVAAVATTLAQARRDRRLRGVLHRLRLRLPLFGKLIAKGVHARVSATLASMLAAGVPLVEALDFAASTSASVPHEDDLLRVKALITDGRTFAAALGESGLWPEAMVQLIEVGEETGRIVTTMELYAQRSTDEVEAATSQITTLIEPLMMVMIGGVVGVFLLALYLPIIDLGNQIK